MLARLAAICISTLALHGCSGGDGDRHSCPPSVDLSIPGIEITVSDSVTLIPVQEATADILSGTFQQLDVRGFMVTPTGPYVIQAARDRPDVYTVTVKKQGYRNWTMPGVSVEVRDCSFYPVKLEARLQPTA